MQSLSNLFASAVKDEALSPAGSAVINLRDYGAQIQAGLGIDVGNVAASEVSIIGMLLDDSGSLSGKEGIVRAGGNEIILALRDSKQKTGMYAHATKLNGGTIYPFSPITSVPMLDGSNYHASGGTPLYTRTIAFVATMVAKLQEFADAGVTARAVSLIVTDGADSSGGRPEDVAPLIQDLLRSEQHTVFGMGIDDGVTDFRDIFRRMGLRPEHVIVSGNSPSEIRQKFGMVSQSMVTASQNGGGGVSLSAGGFGG